MPNVSPEERLRLLIDNCDRMETDTYVKNLSPEELDIKRELLTENYIRLSELEDDMARVKASHKMKVDPIKAQNRTLLNEVRNRRETKEGRLFFFADFDNNLMRSYDENVDLIEERRLRPEERQGVLKPIRQAAIDQ